MEYIWIQLDLVCYDFPKFDHYYSVCRLQNNGKGNKYYTLFKILFKSIDDLPETTAEVNNWKLSEQTYGREKKPNTRQTK